jgi:superfamily II DNA/RNA helicase
VKVLVATDVAARGVHVDDVELVVHVDPPMEHKAYLHRSGRTARAGSEGDVVTIVLPAQEKDVAQLLRKAGIQVGMQRVTKESDAVTALVGDVAAYVKPSLRQPTQPQGGGRSQGANAQRKRAARDEQGSSGHRSRTGGERSRSDRADRSGRPAASGVKSSGSARTGGSSATRSGSGSVYSTSTGAGPTSSSRSYSAPSGNARRPNRRAGRPTG